MCDSPAAESEIGKSIEGTSFRYSASLRIFGSIPSIDELSRRLRVPPTHAHRRGEERGPHSRPYQHDMWLYKAPVLSTEPLHVHIDDLLELKKGLTVDVFLGYRSSSDNAGVEVPAKSLEMFVALQVPFGLFDHHRLD